MARNGTSASDVNRIFTVRVGKTLRVQVRVPSTPTTNDDLSAYEARLQIRDLRNRRRVLIDTKESPGGILERSDPGSWELTLGKKYTSWLPYKCSLEIDLQNKTDPDDVRPLLSTTLHITPEEVTND